MTILEPLTKQKKSFFCYDFLSWQSITSNSKEIQKFIAKKLPRKFRFILIHDPYNIGKHFKFEEGQAFFHNSGVVFKLNCSCGQSCIGQTRRSLITKINNHRIHVKSPQESDVAKHLPLNPDHCNEFNSLKIIGRSSSNRKLRIKETLLI